MSYRIEIDPNDPQSIQRALNTEWLLTNGLGGYAMGTALGVNTRRYHGLLIAATKPPVGRIVALHSMIEQLVIPREDGSEEVIDLSTQQFVGPGGEPMLHPGGWRWLTTFEHENREFVSWTWNVRGIVLSKRIVFEGWKMNVLNVSYAIERGTAQAQLRIRPFLAFRDFHQLTRDGTRSWQARQHDNRVHLDFDELEAALEYYSIGQWQVDMQCWRRFVYVHDQTRDQDAVEDVWSPGYVNVQTAELQRGLSLDIWAYRRSKNLPNLNESDGFERDFFSESPISQLRLAADRFIVERWSQTERSMSVIAGYPWFGDWGRDTMIALPALMLCTNRFDEARSCLMLYSQHLRNGLIPNVFDDYGGAAHYNTADASLWFVNAVYQYWTTTGNAQSREAAELIDACRQIIRAYRNGTDFNIYMDEDGLISAGDEGSQLTWMDAKRDGIVFTPRHGKAVEINALWFNALNCLAEMTTDSAEREELLALSRKVADSFRAKFWWQDGGRGCLFDVLTPNAKQKIRPNQIFAVSLPFSPLYEDQQRAVVKIVEDKLLTPFGLRTLDRDDPDYRGRYEGNLFERDRAYHNGTVWPWLIGPYCEAVLRVNKFSDQAKQRVRAILPPLIDEMSNTEGGRCLGQIAEVYDGDAPHRPGGCPAQAWSVAEVLRILKLVESSKGLGT